ncbi:parallel beta-helix repeat (two copies) [Aciduliprofundum sp. MAR08-339]|uniref:right-handed parallel beta-helix repeat-containing protein n=1 Tax=Aciduliprofundum sp. (strain MAR08-339) TaxID=673860 RepID=UPI0002A4895A|nr:parallel beta-helix repeat (two copies) [Aciduliprofundum sp. MAR08-339]
MSNIKRYVIGGAVVCILLIFLGALLFPLQTSIDHVNAGVHTDYVKGLVKHDPIKIDSNKEFQIMASNENWPGSGSFWDPYIIENYDINGTNALWGIYIGNVTAYFTIKNCHIHHVNKVVNNMNLYHDAGIEFYNVSHGKINNNVLEHNKYGIAVFDSPYTLIYGNTCRNHTGESIFLASDYSRAINNTCSYNGYGIMIEASHTRVENNTLIRSAILFYMDTAQFTEVHNNTIIESGFIFNGGMTCYKSQNISIDNTVNGKPVYYYKNMDMSSVSVPSDGGQIILVNVQNARIENEDLSNTTRGVIVGYSSYIHISNSKFYSDGIGIRLKYSSSITVTDCKFVNSGYGLYIYHTDYVSVARNEFYYSPGHNPMYIDVTYSQGNKITDNQFLNGYYGIKSYEMYSTLIQNNSFSNTNIPVDLADGDHLEVLENTMVDSGNYGIIMWGYEFINIEGNHINNGDIGIELHGVSHGDVKNNVISNMTSGIYKYGLDLEYSYNVTIYNNKIENCTYYGIYLDSHSENNTIYRNYFYYNHGSGDSYDSSHVQARDDGHNNVWNSTLSGNYWQDWRGPDSNGDGVVDDPYIIDGIAHSQDYLPIASQSIPELNYLLILLPLIAAMLLLRRRW